MTRIESKARETVEKRKQVVREIEKSKKIAEEYLEKILKIFDTPLSGEKREDNLVWGIHLKKEDDRFKVAVTFYENESEDTALSIRDMSGELYDVVKAVEEWKPVTEDVFSAFYYLLEIELREVSELSLGASEPNEGKIEIRIYV